MGVEPTNRDEITASACATFHLHYWLTVIAAFTQWVAMQLLCSVSANSTIRCKSNVTQDSLSLAGIFHL